MFSILSNELLQYLFRDNYNKKLELTVIFFGQTLWNGIFFQNYWSHTLRSMNCTRK